MEDTADDVRPVAWLLVREEVLSNLWPSWVGSHCKKDVRLSILDYKAHGILVVLVHISVTTMKRGR